MFLEQNHIKFVLLLTFQGSYLLPVGVNPLAAEQAKTNSEVQSEICCGLSPAPHSPSSLHPRGMERAVRSKICGLR